MAAFWSRTLMLAIGIVLSAAPARADVVDRSATGFTLETTVQVAAAPDQAFRTLVDVGSWWGKSHTYSGESRNMSIAAQPGGCFCERLANGGGVEHGRVVFVAPGSTLRLQAALGPLQEMGLTGSWTWQIAAAGPGSTITMTYAVGGYAPGGLEKLAPLVDQVLTEQVNSLKALIDRTTRDGSIR